MSDNPLTIVRLESNNIKRIKAVVVEPDPDDNLIVVSGKNGQGKTSLLDSIALALGGGKEGKATTLPIREGETQASVLIDFGDFTVTRRWDEAGTRLTVMSKDGATYKSPQGFLDDRLGALSFDPLAFTRKSPKDQLADLLELVDLPFDPLELEAEKDAIFGRRTDVNRSIRNMEGELVAYDDPELDDTPDELVSTGDILTRLHTAEQQQASNQAAHTEVEALARQVAAQQANIDQLAQTLAHAQGILHTTQAALEIAEDTVDALPPVPDLESFRADLSNVEATNDRVRRKQERKAIAGRVAGATNASESLTMQLEAMDKRKAEALAAATMPVEGLAFDKTGVTYNGIPFGQCSAAEQLRVSTAMAMALNPTIGVIRITDGSLLDADNLNLLREMAEGRHMQVWLEVVTNEDGVGFEMVDGSLA